jgi:hypothetical protein
LSDVVGTLSELQQTPRADTADPPSDVTSPPDVAEVWVILFTDATAIVGTSPPPFFLQLIRIRRNSPAKSKEKLAKRDNLFFINN